jgi:hypothetical protein
MVRNLIPHRLCRRLLISILLLLLPVSFLYGQSLPLLIIADFDYSGVSDSEMKLLVDIFSYTVFETGNFIVLNRYERNKLLKGFGYNSNRLKEKQAYMEAGELLRAEYLITGSCTHDNDLFSIALYLWEVKTNALVNTISGTYLSLEEMINGARSLNAKLVAPFRKTGYNEQAEPSSGLSETLYVSRILQRILVVFPTGTRTDVEAGFHVLINEACTFLYQSDRMNIQFSSRTYTMTDPDVKTGITLLKKRDCHTLGLLECENDSYFLVLYTDEKTQVLKIPCFPERERKEEAERIAWELKAELPPLPLKTIARELSREMLIKEKLDMLLFNEKFLSQQLFINLHQSIFKPAVVGKYHPLLNILSFEADVYWYYAKLIGSGAGYAVSLGYPATIDSKLYSHPLVFQHEFRLIPFSFRSAGQIGIMANIMTCFNMHNAYRIVYNSIIDKYDHVDEVLLWFFKVSLNAGLLINVSEMTSVFVDLVTLSYIIPFNIGRVTYDGTAISGALGGIGVIIRF